MTEQPEEAKLFSDNSTAAKIPKINGTSSMTKYLLKALLFRCWN
jgi:hypothetical protein